MFEECGLQKGDKVAICSRNQANWAVTFLAILTHGAVPVPLLHEFKSANIHHLVNHSEAKILFVDEVIWEGLSETEMPDLHAIIQVNNFRILYAKDESIVEAKAHLNELFGRKYPEAFTPDCINYYEDTADELAVINYTSGTSGFSKGVMIPYRAIFSNIEFAKKVLPQLNNTSRVVSMLPCAHMYGLMFEVLYELSAGCHVHFLSRLPSPKIIMQALAEVKPNIVIAVPLVIEKIYKNKVKPVLEKEGIKFLMKVPGLNQVVLNKVRNELINAFGGEFIEVIIGGAAFNKEVEAFFKRMNFPFTVGYGMTECAPIITYDDWKEEKLYSCGKIVPNMEIRIDSEDPQNISGEILVKGANVFLGYFKNEEATAEVFTDDGWFRTGDAGYMKDGFLFLTERIKDLFKTSNGKYIAPQAIETKMVVDRYIDQISIIADERKFVAALIVPDYGLVKKYAEDKGIKYENMAELLKNDAIMDLFRERIDTLQQQFAHYEQIKKFTLLPEPFSMAKGELTNTLKIKRSVLNKNYAAEIEAMYKE